MLDQKESEKQMIFSELNKSKQRQELLEQRLSKMVEVLMKACHSMGIGAISDQDLRGMHPQIANEPSDGNKRFKRARLTMDNQGGDLGTSYRRTDYKQTDEWLDSLMQGMSNMSEAQAQGCFGGAHHQMRITRGNISPRLFSQHNTLTEIHDTDDAPYNIEIENPDVAAISNRIQGNAELEGVDCMDSISKHISTGVVAAGAPPLSLGIYDEEPRLSVPQSPALDSMTIDTRSEAGDDLAKSLCSQTLDLDALLSPSAAHLSPVRPPSLAAASLLQSEEVALGSFGSLISCSQVAEMARQAIADSKLV